MSVALSVTDDDFVAPEIVASIFHSASVVDELARLGATYLQGFSLAEPMSRGHGAAWFASRPEPAR